MDRIKAEKAILPLKEGEEFEYSYSQVAVPATTREVEVVVSGHRARSQAAACRPACVGGGNHLPRHGV